MIHLNIVEDFLAGEGIKYLRLVSTVESPTFLAHMMTPKDGNTPQAQRQKDMDAFNAPDSEYFLYILSTRAGGVSQNRRSLVRAYRLHHRCWYQLMVRGYCHNQCKGLLLRFQILALDLHLSFRMSISTHNKICKCVQ